MYIFRKFVYYLIQCEKSVFSFITNFKYKYFRIFIISTLFSLLFLLMFLLRKNIFNNLVKIFAEMYKNFLNMSTINVKAYKGCNC